MAGTTSGNGGSGSASGNAGTSVADVVDLEKLVNEQLNKALGPRLARILEKVESAVSEEALTKRFESFAAARQAPDQQKPEAEGISSDPQRLSLKALEKQVNDLNQQLKKRDEAIEQKELQRIDAIMRSQVREGLAGVLGADNPNLGLAMDSLYDARKRFVAGQDGAPLVKFKSEYGTEDEHLSLKDGLKKLAESELKHLMPSRTSSLPAAPGGRRGNPVAAQANGAMNPLDRIMNEVVSHVASPSADPTQK